jgi:hypothetical protein
MSKELSRGIIKALEIGIKEHPEKFDEIVDILVKGIDDKTYIICVRGMAKAIKTLEKKGRK